MNDQPVIEVDSLGKTYRDGWLRRRRLEVLRGVTLDVRPGEVFGLLGPNGAGKTTFIKILLGIVRRSAGDARLLGLPAGDRRSRRLVGFLPENLRMGRHHTALSALDYYGKLNGLSARQVRQRSGTLLQTVGLADRARDSVAKYSKGMLQRLGLGSSPVARSSGGDPGRTDRRPGSRRPRSSPQHHAAVEGPRENGLSEQPSAAGGGTRLRPGRDFGQRFVAVCRTNPGDHDGRIRETAVGCGRAGPELGTRRRRDGDSGRVGRGRSRVLAAAGSGAVRVVLKSLSQADVDGCIDRLRKHGVSITGLSRVRRSLEEAFLAIVAEPAEETCEPTAQ